mgnify:CR=1 FL=1
MKIVKRLQLIPLISILTVIAMVGCQPKKEQSSATAEKVDIPLIQAKVVAVKIPKQKLCLEDGCTSYDLQTVETKQKWIDEYFINRMKKAEPNAFANIADQKVKLPADEPSLSESSTYVRFLGQNYNLATFAIQTYSYPAGAAHGIHHQEFVTFDLKQKKRLALQDIMLPNTEAKMTEELFNHNYNWLDEHDISREKFKLSDNFYYGANGLVFVYPLYELASYAEGMPELILPYYATEKLIKSEYLPSLPQYPSQ